MLVRARVKPEWLVQYHFVSLNACGWRTPPKRARIPSGTVADTAPKAHTHQSYPCHSAATMMCDAACAGSEKATCARVAVRSTGGAAKLHACRARMQVLWRGPLSCYCRDVVGNAFVCVAKTWRCQSSASVLNLLLHYCGVMCTPQAVDTYMPVCATTHFVTSSLRCVRC